MKSQLLISACFGGAACLTWGSTAQANDSQTVIDSNLDGMTANVVTNGDEIDVSVQDARGVTTSLKYNLQGQMLLESSPEAGVVSYKYDSFNRMKRIAVGGGVTTRIHYDDQGRLSRQVWRKDGVENIASRYTYDDCDNGENKLCRMKHNGHTTSYGYTAEGQLAFARNRLENEDADETIQYGYNDLGQLSTMRYPSGLKVVYRYDADGRVKKVTGGYDTGEDRERFIVVKALSYDPDGRVKSFEHGDGTRTAYKYDGEGRLKRITKRQENVVVSQDVYKYDLDGRIDEISRLDATHTRQYEYDTDGRLEFEVHGDGTSGGSTLVSYSHDAVGNRLSRTVDGEARNYSYATSSNALVKNGQQDVFYDARGNLVEDRKGKRRFEYDSTNRMSAFYKDGELRAEYDYDVYGQRIRKRLHRANSDGTKSVRFLYDTIGRLVSETARRDDKSALRARDLVWLGKIAVAQVDRRVKSDGTTRRADVLFLHTDHLGAPREATDETGTVVWQWHGDAFGAKAGNSPAVNRDPDGDGQKIEISLRFPGQYHDRESKLWYNHYRDYDPTLGRYVQSDPIGLNGGVNRYAYVGVDPVNWVDPNGLNRICYQNTGVVNVPGPSGDTEQGPWRGSQQSTFSTQYCWSAPIPGFGPITPIYRPTTPPPPPPEEEEEEEEDIDQCRYIVTPSGIGFWLPPGFELVDGGVPGSLNAGYHYMRGPDGRVYSTGYQLGQQTIVYEDLQNTNRYLGGGAFVGTVGFLRFAPTNLYFTVAGGVTLALGSIDQVVPTWPSGDCG